MQKIGVPCIFSLAFILKNQNRNSQILVSIIHFALNCGAKGCPPIGVYSAESLDSQLDRATRGYLDETVVDISKNIVKISMLFKWYRHDFGRTDEEIVSWIEEHASTEISSALKNNRDTNEASPTVEYLAYDWNLQSSPTK